jgi:hypothetical protein
MEAVSFESALRSKFRYKSPVGEITTEDLWALNLDQLNVTAITLKKEVDASKEESFIKTRSKSSKTIEEKFNIVLYVIDVLLKEKELKALEKEKAVKRAALLELINEKEQESLKGKSVEELKAELVALD